MNIPLAVFAAISGGIYGAAKAWAAISWFRALRAAGTHVDRNTLLRFLSRLSTAVQFLCFAAAVFFVAIIPLAALAIGLVIVALLQPVVSMVLDTLAQQPQPDRPQGLRPGSPDGELR